MVAAPPLADFIDEELLRAPLSFDRVIDAVHEVWRLAAPPSAGVRHAIDPARTLRHHREALMQHALRALRRAVQPADEAAAADFDPFTTRGQQPLALIDEAEVSADIELARCIEAITVQAENELRELQTYTSALVGDLNVSRDTNPFRPEVMVRALWRGVQALPLPRAHQAAFMREAARPLAQAMALAYRSAAGRLAERGIQPATHRTILTVTSALGMATRPQLQPPPEVQAVRDSLPMPWLVTEAPTGRTAAGPGAGGATTRWPAAALPAAWAGSAAERPAGTPPGTSSGTSPGASAAASTATSASASAGRGSGPYAEPFPGRLPAPAGLAMAAADLAPPATAAGLTAAPTAARAMAPDPRAIAWLSRLFDEIQADRSLPTELAALLRRLQPAAERQAAEDAALLRDYEHPLWRFMDELAHGVVLATPADRLRLLGLAQHLIDQLLEPGSVGAAAGAARFRWARERVQAMSRHAVQQALQAAGPEVERRRQEALASPLALATGTARARQPALSGADDDAPLDIANLDTVPADLLPDAVRPSAEASPLTAWVAQAQAGDHLRAYLQGDWRLLLLLAVDDRLALWLLRDQVTERLWSVRPSAIDQLATERLARRLQVRSLARRAAERVLQPAHGR